MVKAITNAIMKAPHGIRTVRPEEDRQPATHGLLNESKFAAVGTAAFRRVA